MNLSLEILRPCLEGSIPSRLVTCAADGMPNVAYISQVDYVDSRHVALSFQFFNKTRENILVNPRAMALVIHPQTGQTYQLALRYLHTETSGPVFERMKARLAGIASHTGMAGVFRLRGSDIYQVEQIDAKPGKVLPEVTERRACVSALRQACDHLAGCSDLDMLLQTLLSTLQRQRGIRVDTAQLSQRLGIPVVETVAIRRNGVNDLQLQLQQLAAGVEPGAVQPAQLHRSESVEALYARIEALLADCVAAPVDLPPWQDRLDALVMHPVLGCGILLTILLLMFQAVFAWAAPLVDAIDGTTQALGGWIGAQMSEGVLRNLLVDGIVAGAGGVLVFLPQIVILFAFILALEDSGYLPRGAFLLDRLMRGVGLSGRSFIPLLSSFACAVPGIMATRTIQDPKERLITIMIAPLMTCSARLPVYAVIIAAFIPRQTVYGLFNLQGLVLFALYAAGIVSAAIIAWIMRRHGAAETFPLLLELPSYRWPDPLNLLRGLWERIWIFLRRVGTIILALSILLWFLASYPAAPLDATAPAIEYSFAGRLGQWMQPLFAPLGFNWQMCIALIPAMGAREVAVSALATVYAIAGGGEASPQLATTLAQAWSLPVALAYLAWFVYAPQCLSTIAVVKRETNSWRTTGLFVVYLFVLAYLAAWATYNVASAVFQ